MTTKIEKLPRGNPIWPPCDRCRRLAIPCQKHLTACSGCTKKHAKCSWRDIEQTEVEMIAKGEEGEGLVEGPGGAEGMGQAGHGQGMGMGTEMPIEGVRNGHSYGESVSSAASGAISPGPNGADRVHNGISGAGAGSGGAGAANIGNGPATTTTESRERERDEHSLLSQMATAAAAVAGVK